jgi:hypothetical protein
MLPREKKLVSFRSEYIVDYLSIKWLQIKNAWNKVVTLDESYNFYIAFICIRGSYERNMLYKEETFVLIIEFKFELQSCRSRRKL